MNSEQGTTNGSGSGGRQRAGRFDAGAVVLLGVLLLAVLLAPVYTRAESKEVAWFGAAAIWVALWGLATDRWVLPRGLRGSAAIAAAVGLHYAGLRIGVLKLPFSTTFVSLGAWSLPAAALWMWLCSALFARAGTIPGVAYGVGMVACGTLIAVCDLQGAEHASFQAWWFSHAIGLVCLLWFLAKLAAPVPTGTAGAYLLGFLIGTVSIMGMLKNTAFLAAVLPLLLISVPLFGATYAYVADLRRGTARMALTQRREHLHWLLLREGYSPVQIAVLFTLGAAWCGLLAILLVRFIEVSFLVKAAILVAVLGVGIGGGFVLLRILPRSGGRSGAIRLLGVRITPVSMEEALGRAHEFIAEGSPHMIVTSDATGVIRAQEDPELREIMDRADLVTADGQGVVLAARLLNVPIRERVSGVDMVQRLCEVATEAGRSVFLLGGAEGIADAAAERLEAAVPGLQVAGVQNGYFTPEEESAIIERIREARPAVLFVAFGIPKQEKWIRAHMQELGVPVCIGVGGSFDVISGRLKRAPVWMRKCGLEWLYRVMQEPWRLPRLKSLPKMAWIALTAALRGETGDYVE